MAQKLVTLVSGHQLLESVHQSRLKLFAKKIEDFGGKVCNMCKPAFNYDYSYIVYDLKTIPRDLLEFFGRANLKVKHEELIPGTFVVSVV